MRYRNRRTPAILGALFALVIAAVSLKSPGASSQVLGDALWLDIPESSILAVGQRVVTPQSYRTVRLDQAALAGLLGRAPLEFTEAARLSAVTLELPMPDGTAGRFRVEESPIMEPALALKYPAIKTYRGQGIDDPTASARFDLTPHGFHAFVISARGTFFVDRYAEGDTTNYVV